MWESASSARATRLPLALTVKALVMWAQNSTEMPQLCNEVHLYNPNPGSHSCPGHPGGGP